MFDGEVVITGIGQSQIGRRLGRSGLSLAVDAALAAIEDAGLTPDDVDGLATYPGADNTDPGFVGAGAAELKDVLGLPTKWFLGAAEVAGQLGPVIAACAAVRAGLADHVLCFRALTESSAQAGLGRRAVLPGGPMSRPQSERHWSSWSAPFGAPSPVTGFALTTRLYMHRYGLTREQLAQVALTDRRHAALNDKAVLRSPLTMEDYLGAKMISEPLTMFDCDIASDGATAVVVSRAAASRGLRRPPLTVRSAAGACLGRYSFDGRNDYLTTAAHDSGQLLWEGTTLRPGDVDVAEIYDGFSMLSLLWLEGLGFCGVGEAGKFLEGGERVALDGQLPMNTQGGQLSGGRLHGLGFLHEACLQLWGDGGARQVAGSPSVSLAAVGGGPFCGCMLLSRES